MAMSTCARCGVVFTSLSAFDRHLGKITPGQPLECRDPAAVGLKMNNATGRWSLPPSKDTEHPLARATQHRQQAPAT